MPVQEMDVFKDIIMKELSLYNDDISSLQEKMVVKKTMPSVIWFLILLGISILCFVNKQIEVGVFPLIVAAIVLAIFIATKPTLESVKEELADTVFYNMRLRPTMDVGEVVKAVIAMKMAK